MISGAMGMMAPELLAILGLGTATFMPQTIMSQFWKMATGPAQRFTGFAGSAYEVARAGGYGADSFMRQFYTLGNPHGGMDIPGWMLKYNVSPEEAIRNLGSVGVLPEARARGINRYASPDRAARAVSLAMRSEGFANLPDGTAGNVTREALGRGFIQPTGAGIEQYLTRINAALVQAQAEGLDKSKVLNSMLDAMETVARMGGPQGGSSWMMNFLLQTGRIGTPQAMTGELGANIATSAAANFGNIMSNPTALLMAGPLMRQFNGFRSKGDIEALIGGKPDKVEQSYWNEQIGMIQTEFRLGHTGNAIDLLFKLGRGSPQLLQTVQNIAGSILPGLSPGIRARVLAQMGFGDTSTSSMDQALALMHTGGPLAGAAGGASSSDLFHAMERTESGGNQFDTKGHTLTSSKGAFGVMQITEGAIKDIERATGAPVDRQLARTDAAYNRKLGQFYMNMLLKRYNGDTTLALTAYNAGMGRLEGYRDKSGIYHRGWLKTIGDPRTGQLSDAAFAAAIPIGETHNYVATIRQHAGAAALEHTGNVPLGGGDQPWFNPALSSASQMEMAGSERAANVFLPAVKYASDTITQMIDGARAMKQGFDGMIRAIEQASARSGPRMSPWVRHPQQSTRVTGAPPQ